MRHFQIKYYNERVEEDILKLPKTIRAKYFQYADMLEEFGANLGMPHTRAIGDGLFELRIKGKEGIARALYCTMIGKQIIILYSFIKKTEQTPQKELEVAKKRKLEVQNG